VIPSSWSDAARRRLAGRFVRDTLTLQAGQGVALVVQAVVSLVVLRLLGPEHFGVWTLSQAFITVAGLLDPSAAHRVALVEVARSLGADDRAALRDALAAFLRVSATVNVALAVALALAAPVVAREVYSRTEVGLWAAWLGLVRVVDLPWSLLVVVQHGRRRMTSLVGFESVRQILSSLLAVALLLAGLKVGGLVAAQLAASVGAAITGLVVYRRIPAEDPRFPTWRELAVRAREVAVRARFWFGMRIAVDKNLGTLATQLPVLMLGALSPTTVGYYAAALRVVALPQPLITGLARNLETVLPQKAGESLAAMRRAFVTATWLSGGLWIVVTLVVALAGPPLLPLVAGASFTPAVAAIYPLLLQSVAAGFGVGAGTMFRTLDRMGYAIVVQAASLALMTPIGYVLIQRAGAVGGAWFHGLRFALMTAASLCVVFWLSRRLPDQGPR
jgi:O-antigen/teichoic acid export membrane protein